MPNVAPSYWSFLRDYRPAAHIELELEHTGSPLGAGVSTALGLQGGALPAMAARPGVVEPVAIVANTADRLSRALIEPRAVAADRVIAAVGTDVPVLLLTAQRAGVVVERIALFTDGAAIPFFSLSVRAVAPTVGSIAPAHQQNIGGQPVISQLLEASRAPLGGLDADVPQQLLSAGTLFELRWFIAAGFTFYVEHSQVNVPIRYFLEYRELLE